MACSGCFSGGVKHLVPLLVLLVLVPAPLPARAETPSPSPTAQTSAAAEDGPNLLVRGVPVLLVLAAGYGIWRRNRSA